VEELRADAAKALVDIEARVALLHTSIDRERRELIEKLEASTASAVARLERKAVQAENMLEFVEKSCAGRVTAALFNRKWTPAMLHVLASALTAPNQRVALEPPKRSRRGSASVPRLVGSLSLNHESWTLQLLQDTTCQILEIEPLQGVVKISGQLDFLNCFSPVLNDWLDETHPLLFCCGIVARDCPKEQWLGALRHEVHVPNWDKRSFQTTVPLSDMPSNTQCSFLLGSVGMTTNSTFKFKVHMKFMKYFPFKRRVAVTAHEAAL
jgi:hypothetical protein